MVEPAEPMKAVVVSMQVAVGFERPKVVGAVTGPEVGPKRSGLAVEGLSNVVMIEFPAVVVVAPKGVELGFDLHLETKY